MSTQGIETTHGTIVTDPPIAKFLFNDKRFAVVWLVIRVLLGWAWLEPGLSKLGNGDWMNGTQLAGFWANQLKTGAGTAHPAVALGWYRDFLQSMVDGGSAVWFAKLVAFGETAIGIALIIGAFVGVAAFFAGFMNWNFIMAGSASTNGLLFAAAVFLVLAWKTAGYWGVDRYLLPRLGTPWAGKPVKQQQTTTATLRTNP